MDKRKETFETWNKIAEAYEARFMDLDIYNSSYDVFCESIKNKSGRVLEIGTGPGNVSKYILSALPEMQIEGIDIAPNMVERAKANIPYGTFEVMDSRDILEQKGPFDGILCGFCIPYLTTVETEKLIADAYQLLGDGGVFYLSFVEGSSEKSGFLTGSSGDRVYFYYHEIGNIKKALSSAGFHDSQTIHVAYKNGKGAEEVHTIVLIQK